MLFNSIPFLLFFSIFFILYWILLPENLRIQNLLILGGSYVFYCWFSWKLGLIILSYSIIAFYFGFYIHKTPDLKLKTRILHIGVIFYVMSLAYFKYLNFFISSLNSAVQFSGHTPNLHTLNIILPLGISFFTFRILSYLFDIRNGKLEPATDLVIFLSYVAFFPSLVAGPIDKPQLLIPQLQKSRVFSYVKAADGLRQILWGLFKKIVVANNAAGVVDFAFGSNRLHGFVLIYGAFFYAIEIYADFSGYSDMALGIAKLLGFQITVNFNNPYFSQNIADFWRRWHISLTSWLTEYIFTPASIAFRDLGKAGSIMAILITFLVSGLWHGANWTFVAWGLLHGCYFIPLILMGKMNKKKSIDPAQFLPSLREAINMMATFVLVMFTLIMFKADSIKSAANTYINIFRIYPFSDFKVDIPLLIYTLSMLAIEWFHRDRNHGLDIARINNMTFRWTIYVGFVFLILFFIVGGEHKNNAFIYMKF